MKIVQAEKQHLDSLAELFDAYRQFYGQAPDLARAREFLAGRMDGGESVVFLALDGPQGLGFTQLYPVFSSVATAPMWLLNDLYVTPGARGRGVGAALLERARVHALESGASQLMLETATDNPARSLYERCGWQLVTERVFYTRDP
jgi:GNAT superfamily N-acetyltransferase